MLKRLLKRCFQKGQPNSPRRSGATQTEQPSGEGKRSASKRGEDAPGSHGPDGPNWGCPPAPRDRRQEARETESPSTSHGELFPAKPEGIGAGEGKKKGPVSRPWKGVTRPAKCGCQGGSRSRRVSVRRGAEAGRRRRPDRGIQQPNALASCGDHP